MKIRYRIVEVQKHTGNPYRVQLSAPLPLGWLTGWEFVEPWRWHKTLDDAQEDVADRMASDGDGCIVVVDRRG